MTYRLFLILFIAFIILGTSAIVLGVYINTRDAEARILASQILDCLSKDGKINLDLIPVADRNKFLDYCGINNTGRFYIKIDFLDAGNSFLVLQHGDSGKKAIKTIFDKGDPADRLKVHAPGYFQMNFNSPVLRNNNLKNAEIIMEVLVLDDETA